MLESRRMTADSRAEARALLHDFLHEDEFYLDSSPGYGDGGSEALERALDLFLARPELGFVWLAFDDGQAVAVCVVSLAVSTSAGSVVARLDDMYVRADRQGRGHGAAHLDNLKRELRRAGLKRIDSSVHVRNDAARRFYQRHGFRSLAEDRIACLL